MLLEGFQYLRNVRSRTQGHQRLHHVDSTAACGDRLPDILSFRSGKTSPFHGYQS